MSSTYGENLKLSIFGQSHGAAIGMTLDGIPAGLPVDFEKLQEFLNRRAPGRSSWSTPRKESDTPEFLSGVVDNYTCGAPLAAVIRNTNIHSADYSNLKDIPRPGHADYTAQIKYGGFQDVAGGGHFSGRLTAPLCIAGGLCKQWLEEMFKLYKAIRHGERIELTSDFFSRRLLFALYKDGAFSPSEYNGYCEYNDYKFLLDMFNKRIKSDITMRQRSKIRGLIAYSIRPYLMAQLRGK